MTCNETQISEEKKILFQAREFIPCVYAGRAEWKK